MGKPVITRKIREFLILGSSETTRTEPVIFYCLHVLRHGQKIWSANQTWKIYLAELHSNLFKVLLILGSGFF